MDKVVFSWRGERPNGKHLLYKRCFSFPVKVEHIPFLTWPLHNISRLQQWLSREMSAVSSFSFILLSLLTLRKIYFHGEFVDGQTQMKTSSEESVQKSLRSV